MIQKKAENMQGYVRLILHVVQQIWWRLRIGDRLLLNSLS